MYLLRNRCYTMHVCDTVQNRDIILKEEKNKWQTPMS